ncbi:hypothetical protein FRB99_006061 [Tulasnella sp. 403]|nr:hypothetical protein FRB99_006061 [Tulasnella sp. 403]
MPKASSSSSAKAARKTSARPILKGKRKSKSTPNDDKPVDSPAKPAQTEPTPSPSKSKEKAPLKSILKKPKTNSRKRQDDPRKEMFEDVEDVEKLNMDDVLIADHDNPIPAESAQLLGDDEDSDEKESSKEGDDDAVYLKGFSDDEDDEESDSSDEDDVFDGVDVHTKIEVEKLPHAKDDATVKRRLAAAKREPPTERGVVYVGRIPHGFYEDEMRKYFSQFGTVTRLRLSRSKRTGRSKGYAFVEFEHNAVAKIVSETMDNYLMVGHLLQCKIVPKEKVHPNMWIGANKKFRLVPRYRVERAQRFKERTKEEQAKTEARRIRRREERQAKLEAMGLDYDMSKAISTA